MEGNEIGGRKGGEVRAWGGGGLQAATQECGRWTHCGGRWEEEEEEERNGQVGWAVLVARAGRARPVPDSSVVTRSRGCNWTSQHPAQIEAITWFRWLSPDIL